MPVGRRLVSWAAEASPSAAAAPTTGNAPTGEVPAICERAGAAQPDADSAGDIAGGPHGDDGPSDETPTGEPLPGADEAAAQVVEVQTPGQVERVETPEQVAQVDDAEQVAQVDDAEQAARDEAHNGLLDAVREGLVEDSRAWARRVRLLCELERLSSQSALAGVPQFRELEAAGSWNVSQLTAAGWAADAHRLESCLPLTLAALEVGTLLVHQAQVLLHRTRHCPDHVARAVEAELLPTAAGLTPADLRKRVDRSVLRVESEQASAEAAEQRHAEAASDRHVFTRPDVDGMAVAGAVLTAEQLVAWKSGLDRLEQRERLADQSAGIDRTAEQRRADLFAALPAMVLAGTAQDRASRDVVGPDDAAAPTGPLAPWTFTAADVAAQVVLNVLVPVATVLDLSREPGDLIGYGPVSAEHVRLVRPHAFRRVLVDSVTGKPLHVDDRVVPAAPGAEQRRGQVRDMLRPAVITNADEPHHDPSARLARLVDLRDVHCCGPGCSSSRTDRDHLVPWPRGATSERNLGRLSRRCHLAKHHGWVLRRHVDGGSSWTSPLRRTYDRPGPHPPPPQVDVWQDPPPPRPSPVVGSHWPTGEDATAHAPAREPGSDQCEAEPAGDEPPF